MPRYGHAVLGGTFDRLHVGHAALLAAAFAAGRRVSVGLTTDRFVRSLAKPGARTIQPYAARRRALRRWLARHFPRRSWRVVALADRFGRSVGPGVDVLVVSAETAGGGRAVNAERLRRGLARVPVVTVPLVLGDDLVPVSSRRIRAGAIDRRGHRLSALSVGVAADGPDELAAVGTAVRGSFPRARLGPVLRRSALQDPRRRAVEGARRAIVGRELAVAVARRRNGGWIAVERSPGIALDPRPIPGRSRTALAQGLRRLLRPGRPQPL